MGSWFCGPSPGARTSQSKTLRSFAFTLFLLSAFTASAFVGTARAELPPPGLVAWWPGDRDAKDLVSNGPQRIIPCVGIDAKGRRERSIAE
jgi:hypothetical protein